MNWVPFVPELFTLFTAGVFLVLSLFKNRPRRDFHCALWLSGIGLGISILWIDQKSLLFAGTYQIDLYSQVFKIFICAGFFAVVSLCKNLSGVRKDHHSEFYLLLSTGTLGLMLLTSGVHLLTLYVALEMSSYSLYILVYLRKGRAGGLESGLKYFFIGAASSALMLFGFALLYGAAGSAYLTHLAQFLPRHMDDPVVLVGFVFSLSGFFFKLALFPFHFWAPDAYEGAPHPVSAYIATASKVGAIAVLLRLVTLTGGSSQPLIYFLIALSLLSMFAGNLAAIAQTDLKRMLAFSSIAHAGYVMIGILSVNLIGAVSVIYYAASLMVMKYVCFAVVTEVGDDGGNIGIDQLAGLHRRSPVMALALMLALFGLAGVPPTIGFTAKLLVFTGAMQKGLFWLVLLAMVNVVISLYYYLRVLKAAYLLEPDHELPPIRLPLAFTLLMLGLILLMVAGGLFPDFLTRLGQAMAGCLHGSI